MTLEIVTSEEIRPWAYWYAHRVSLDRTGGVLSILRVTSQKRLTAVWRRAGTPNHQNSAFSCSLTHQPLR
jgi:hypothetical protein